MSKYYVEKFVKVSVNVMVEANDMAANYMN